MHLSRLWNRAKTALAPASDYTEPGEHRPLSRTALTTLTSELARHPGPKRVAVVGDDPGVIEHVLDLLGPKDELGIWVSNPLSAVGVRARVAARSRFVTDRVTVWDDTPNEPPELADFALAALGADPTQLATLINQLRALVKEDGVLSIVTPTAIPTTVSASARAGARFGNALLAGDTKPITRAISESQSGMLPAELEEHVVRRDLVLRNSPPIHVHHLRFAVADAASALQLAPAYRPSSVPVSHRTHLDSNGVFFAGLLGTTALLTKLVRPSSRAWLAPALMAAPVAAFFRDPNRRIVDDSRAVVAASDGKVLRVEHVHDDRFGPGQAEWLRIVVFLSVLDVHVNRSPVAGRVVKVIAEDGGYAMAQKPEADHNVAQYTMLETVHGPVVVAQRTGLIARRIVNRARVGALLAKGERFGLIRFGSRTDIYLPLDAADPLVTPGDKVKGGETILARWATH